MKKVYLMIVCIVFMAVCSTTAWGYGYYNWYGGYNTATATAWNGGTSVSWNYGPSGWGWGWGGGAYASTYTNTYPGADYDTSWGWNGASAQSHSAAPGRSADAYAYAYNASWGWWNSGGYSQAIATTSGSPSYATAYAKPSSNWWYTYWVPRNWWYNTWVPAHNWYIPYYMNWYYWGWVDGDQPDMALEMDLSAIDTSLATSQTVLNDGFKDNGDGTFTQLGSTLNPSDLAYNSNVGGTGHAGWDIMGHNGSIGEDPYSLPFLITATDIGGDDDYIMLRVDFSIDGYIGQGPIPEPATLILFGLGGLALLRRKR